MIAIDKFIQIVRLCCDSIGISISIGIDIGIGIVIGVIFLGWNICYYLILDVFLRWTACLQKFTLNLRTAYPLSFQNLTAGS